MKVQPNAPCPCCSGKKYKKCCRPIVAGSLAATPEALMRSRFTAYATGDVRHIMATTHPDGPHHRTDPDQWAREIAAFSDGTRFEQLVVRQATEAGTSGWVHFEAHLERDGQDHSFAEHSEFRRVDGAWLYFAGEPRPFEPA